MPKATIPPIPDDGTVHKQVRQAITAMRDVLNHLLRRSSIVREASTDRWKLGLVLADIPDAIARDTEVTAAIAAAVALLGHPLFDHYADGASVHTNGTEDVLFTDTIAAGRMGSNGEKLAIIYAGYWIGHATATRRLRIYFGGTVVLDTNNILISADAAWEVRVSIIRVSASIVRVSAVLVSEAAPQEVYTTSSEITGLTLANTQIVKITGTADAAGAAAADIVARHGTISWEPAA